MPDTKYNILDTIIAVSSPASSRRVIIRITGNDTFEVCRNLFNIESHFDVQRRILRGKINLDNELEVNALLYFFPSGNSYTGDDIAEIHFYSNPALTKSILDKLLQQNLRIAEPGEFTARAYLNGKMDLAQAEAVNEIIVGSNEFQLSAAEKLLSGRLSKTINEIRSSIMNCLSLIEAGLDFSSEDIEFITLEKAIENLNRIREQLEKLLAGSIQDESIIDLPSVGIAGAPNAGKSTLVNKLLGSERSIVSEKSKTTRDVLTGLMSLEHCRCVLFDCAGLISEPDNILDELAQESAIEALRNSAVVVFCVDISKNQWSQDFSIRQLIEPKILIPVATKCDLIPEKDLPEHLEKLNELFAAEFLLISAKTGKGTKKLLEIIDSQLVSQTSYSESGLALILRHKQAVTEAITNLSESINELIAGNDEVTAMMLRAAYKAISEIEQQHVDEQILEQIFSRFCIGK
jgi:tRNA modification GTPase